MGNACDEICRGERQHRVDQETPPVKSAVSTGELNAKVVANTMVQVGDGPFETKRQGESFHVPRATMMTVKNDTGERAQLLSVLVVVNDGKWLKYDPKDCAKE